MEQARDIARELVDKLRWSTWRECGSCPTDEICLIPMFPVGTVDDYFHPTCKNMSQIDTGYFVVGIDIDSAIVHIQGAAALALPCLTTLKICHPPYYKDQSSLAAWSAG